MNRWHGLLKKVLRSYIERLSALPPEIPFIRTYTLQPLCPGSQYKSINKHGGKAPAAYVLSTVAGSKRTQPFKHFHFGGIAAWFAWMGFHLLQLIGVKNRIVIFVNWVYQYLTYDQNLRLLFKDRQPPRRKPVAGKVPVGEDISV